MCEIRGLVDMSLAQHEVVEIRLGIDVADTDGLGMLIYVKNER